MSKGVTEFSTGDNLLMISAAEGNVAEVQRILAQQKVTDVNAVNKNGYTALALAVRSGSYSIAGKLLVSGADPNIKNHSGQSPLFLACWHNQDNIARLLIENGGDINTTDQRGWTPLMIATYHAHLAVVKLLLSLNADVFVQDCFGKRAIHRAKEPAILRLLQQAEGVDVSSPSKSSAKSPGRSILKQDSAKTLKSSSSTKQFNRSQEFKKTTAFALNNSQLQQSTSVASLSSISKKGSASPTPKNLLTNSANKKSNASLSVKTLSETPSRSLKGQRKSPMRSPMSKSSSPNPAFNSTSSSQMTGGLSQGVSPVYKRTQFKEELSRIMTEQINYYAQKTQTLLLQRLSYEIPVGVQSQQSKIRSELEQLINLRMGNIVKSLSTHFNLKLKFALNKAGYDTNSVDLKPFLENEDEHKLEISPVQIHKDHKIIRKGNDDLADLEKLRKEVQRMEGEARSVRYQIVIGDDDIREKFRDDSDKAFGSFGNRWQVRDHLEEQLNEDFRANTRYLIDYTSDKVKIAVRDEKNQTLKNLMDELNVAIEIIEDNMRVRFEEMIDDKVAQISETLTGVPASSMKRQSSSPFRRSQSQMQSNNITQDDSGSPQPHRENDQDSNISSALLNRSQSGFRSTSSSMFRSSPRRLSPTKAKLMEELDNVRTGPVDIKLADTRHGNFEPRPSYKQEESDSSSFIASATKRRIQGLKEDLDLNFDSSMNKSIGVDSSMTSPGYTSPYRKESTFKSPVQNEAARKLIYGSNQPESDRAEYNSNLNLYNEYKKEITPQKEQKKDTTNNMVTLSEADREAIEERKNFYRNQIRAQAQAQAHAQAQAQA